MATMPRPPAPFPSQLQGSLPDQVRQIADALSRKADQTMLPVYSSVVLMAPGGGAWMVSIDDAGALHTEAVTR